MLQRLHMSFVRAVYIWFLGLLLGGALVHLAWSIYHDKDEVLLKPLVILAFVLVSTGLTFRKVWLNAETLPKA
jgi:hypothetical protein